MQAISVGWHAIPMLEQLILSSVVRSQVAAPMRVMLDLKHRTPDVRRYVANLEEWIIRTLAAFGVAGERREERIGAWVRRPDKAAQHEDKIATIGIRLRCWVSLHGIALNVAPDLGHFAGIVPCGVSDPRYGVTSLADLGREVAMAEVDAVLRREFGSRSWHATPLETFAATLPEYRRIGEDQKD
jgi:lipoate-protein ligase B